MWILPDDDVYFLFQTYFLPVIGLVDPENLTPGDLVVSLGVEGLRRRHECTPHFILQGVNKDSYLILDKLPAE